MKKLIAFLLLCQCLLLSAQITYNPYADLEKKLGTHFPIENFKNEKGEYYSSEYLKGKRTLVNFWSTTCDPCLKELPFLNKLQKSLGNTSQFLAVTYDSREKVDQFLKKRPFTFDHITNAGLPLKSLFTMQRYPTSFILDENGIVIKVLGVVDEEKLPSIEQLLSK